MAGRFIEFNDAYVNLLGYSREELLKMSASDVEAQFTAAEIEAIIERVKSEGHVIFETKHRSKDGRVWPAELNLSYWPIAGGRMFVFLRDITERKRAGEALQRLNEKLEERVMERTEDLHRAVEQLQLEIQDRLEAEAKLQASEARFRSSFYQSPVGMVIADLDFRFKQINPAFCRIIGYTAKELSSMAVTDIVHPDDLPKGLEEMRRFTACVWSNKRGPF